MRKIVLIGILLLIVFCAACSAQSPEKNYTAGTNKQLEAISTKDATLSEATLVEDRNRTKVQSNEISDEDTKQPNIQPVTVPTEKSEPASKQTAPDEVKSNIPSDLDLLTVMQTTVDHAYYGDYESLYNDADLIIIGEPKYEITDAEPVKDSRHHSWREVMIHEVLKGDIKDKEMKVGEEAIIIKNGGDPTLFCPSRQNIMKKGMKYLLFLSQSPNSNDYYIIAGTKGKFNIDGKDTEEIMTKLKEDVLSKYNKK